VENNEEPRNISMHQLQFDKGANDKRGGKDEDYSSSINVQ
jgi:hypothetical protein